MYASGKNLALLLLSLAGVFRLGRWCFRHRLVVLTYHKVLPDRYQHDGPRPPDSLYSWEFEQQIAHIVRWYHVATGEEVKAFLTGADSLPAYSVLITFDDGYENHYTEAFPILQRHGASAMFFLTTGQVGQPDAALWFDRLYAVLSAISPTDLTSWLVCRGAPPDVQDKTQLRLWLKRLSQPDRQQIIAELEQAFGLQEGTPKDGVVSRLMSWDQAREMATQGMTIGSHTVSHQILSSASPDEVRYELSTSRLQIEDEIGRPCWAFCYPNGTSVDFRRSDQDAVRAAGYACAFTQIPGLITPDTDHYALTRLSIPDSGDMRVFLSRLTGVHHSLQAARGKDSAAVGLLSLTPGICEYFSAV